MPDSLVATATATATAKLSPRGTCSALPDVKNSLSRRALPLASVVESVGRQLRPLNKTHEPENSTRCGHVGQRELKRWTSPPFSSSA